MSYAKVFGSLLDSTVWRLDDGDRLIWITMLVMADRDGIVESSVPGLADRARVSRERCEHALAVLSAPDPDSRTKADEGRRIREVDGGWQIVNYEKYRDKATAEESRAKAAERQRRKRDRDFSGNRASVTPCHAPSRPSRDVTDVTYSSQAHAHTHAEGESARERVPEPTPPPTPQEPNPGGRFAWEVISSLWTTLDVDPSGIEAIQDLNRIGVVLDREQASEDDAREILTASVGWVREKVLEAAANGRPLPAGAVLARIATEVASKFARRRTGLREARERARGPMSTAERSRLLGGFERPAGGTR